MNTSCTSVNTAPLPSELSSLLEDESERRYPDLIGNSSYHYDSKAKTTKANSEGGSVSDITDLFCTLPRKRTLVHNSRYKSSDSQSPLLPESRYGSSGGDSSCSSSSRRLSDSQKYQLPGLGKSRANHMSSSYLNLTSARVSNLSSSLVQENPCSTPLLDVNSLENRMFFRPEVALHSPPPISTNITTYDYHAAQLERFLEEYRSLQKQLTKMKETCDTMRQDKISVDNLLQHSLPVTPSTEENSSKMTRSCGVIKPTTPNSNQTLDNAVGFNNYESDLTRYLMSSPKTVNSGTFNKN